MSLYEKFDMGERVDKAHQEAIARLFAAGNPDSATFRRICYSSLADDFTLFMASHAATSLADARALRGRLIEAIVNAEAKYSSTDAPGDPASVIKATSLASDAIPFVETQDKPASVEAAPAQRSASRWRELIAGVIGASLMLLAGLALRQAGIL